MSEAPAQPDGSPLLPQPTATPEKLRNALARLAPTQLPAYDAARTAAVEAARTRVDAAPMRRFVREWAFTIAILRYPDRAERLRRLESRAAQVDDLDEGRAIAAEVAALHAEAAAEAGIDTQGAK